jgi:hypothetical protein
VRFDGFAARRQLGDRVHELSLAPRTLSTTTMIHFGYHRDDINLALLTNPGQRLLKDDYHEESENR